MEILSSTAGLPGLFISCIFAGTMSTVSSGLNSIAAVVWEDILKPVCGHRWSNKKATNCNKIMDTVFHTQEKLKNMTCTIFEIKFWYVD